jgi:hypothetical protein
MTLELQLARNWNRSTATGIHCKAAQHEIRKHPVVSTVLHFMERCEEVPGNFIHTIPTVYTNFTTAGTRTKIEKEKYGW